MTEFITQTVRYGKDLGIELSAERTVCPYLVITPTVTTTKADGVTLTGGLALTHTGTGRSVAVETHSFRLHQLAQKLTTELPEFDWNFTDINHLYANPEKRDAAAEVIRDWQMADAYAGPAAAFGDDDETKARREREPATTLLAEQLGWWIAHAKGYMQGLDWDNEDHQRIRQAEIGVSCQGYATIYLLAVLRTLNPRVADIAARDLVATLDVGDGLAEWIWQWHEEFTEGRPLTLRGIPAHDPLDAFKA